MVRRFLKSESGSMIEALIVLPIILFLISYSLYSARYIHEQTIYQSYASNAAMVAAMSETPSKAKENVLDYLDEVMDEYLSGSGFTFDSNNFEVYMRAYRSDGMYEEQEILGSTFVPAEYQPGNDPNNWYFYYGNVLEITVVGPYSFSSENVFNFCVMRSAYGNEQLCMYDLFSGKRFRESGRSPIFRVPEEED